MIVTRVQMFLFVQSLCMNVRFPNMELTRNAITFRKFYKSNRNLPKNATAIAVLRDARYVMNESKMLDDFFKAAKRYPEVLAKL